MFSSCGSLAKHRVESHELVNVDRLEAKLGSDPFHRLVADKSKVFLPEMKQGQGSTALLIGWIMADCPLHLRFELGWNFHLASESLGSRCTMIALAISASTAFVLGRIRDGACV